MPWDPIRMNSGHSIPSIAFGTWSLGNGQNPIDQLTHVLQNGFNHIDTAQAYGNEAEVGTALRESGRSRTDVFITTKYSGTNGLDIDMSIRNSIVNLGVDYVDLYLIHERHLAVPDIPTAWAKMESIKEAGLARSIGVSNFNEEDLEILLASAEIKPVVNHLLLHPYVYHRQRPVMEYAAKHGIVIGAYMTLTPITHQPGGPLDAPLNAIASRLGATTDQVLFQWTKAKGAVVITTSSKKSRLPGYLTAGDIGTPFTSQLSVCYDELSRVDTTRYWRDRCCGCDGQGGIDAKLTLGSGVLNYAASEAKSLRKTRKQLGSGNAVKSIINAMTTHVPAVNT